MPRFTKKDGGEAGVWHHPSLVFSWKKFCNLQIAEFQKLQEVALHKYSKLPVTHDSMPGQPVDYETVMSSCDFMSMNCYHGYRGYEIVPPNWDRMRAMKKGFHWLFETAPSHSGGDRTWYNHEPLGSERAFLWLNVALGGQGSMFWLWQQHRAGQEMTHGAILSVWGKPFANFPMLKKIGEEFETASEFLMQNPVADARVAIVYSHQAHFGLEIEPYVGDLKYYNDWNQRFALPLWKSFLHRDVIYPSQDLKQYKLLFVPMLPFASSDFRSRLKSWVEAGGTVILGPMTGYRDQDWAAFTEYATGNLEAWTGIETQERMPVSSIPVDPLLPVRLDVTSISLDNKPVCGLWTESLKSNTGKAIAIYSDGLLKGKPAIMENRVGKGKVVVLGTDPGKEMIRKLCLEEARKLDILPEATGEEGVIVSPRLKKGWVLVNLENSPRKITIPEMGSGVNILDGKKISSDAFTLDPYAVMVVRRP
jgi:beta-galactosidase